MLPLDFLSTPSLPPALDRTARPLPLIDPIARSQFRALCYRQILLSDVHFILDNFNFY